MLHLIKTLESDNIKFALSVKNFTSGYSFDYNHNIKVPSASIIKLPIMATALNQVKANLLSLSDRIAIAPEAYVPYSIITMLDKSNTYTLKDLITLMIVQSDNTATNVLIHLLGMDNINKFIATSGLHSTIINRKMMDFDAQEKGLDNLTTSGDINHFLQALYDNEMVGEKYSNIMIDIMKMQLDRTMIYYDIPDQVITAHKTGELHHINHEVGIFYTDKGDYSFCMLTWNSINNNYARKIISKAAKLVYDYFTEC